MKNNEEELRDLVLLDSDSTNTIFCNKEYVKNIQEAKKLLVIHKNGGTLTVTQTCNIPQLGQRCYNQYYQFSQSKQKSSSNHGYC